MGIVILGAGENNGNRKLVGRIDKVFQQSDALLEILNSYNHDEWSFHKLSDELKIQFTLLHSSYEHKSVLICQQADRKYTVVQEAPGSYTIKSCTVGENDNVDSGRDFTPRQMIQDAEAIKNALKGKGLRFDAT